MALTIAQRKAKIRSAVLEKHNRATKERYLMGMGFLHSNAVREMDIKQINELVDNALKVKGF